VSGNEVTLIIDGREVTATEGEMLHDAARRGDVEIPVFCYEPKLGDPVGACRMCLVEIEGIPKLQTSCSTPVRDGMVVHTRTEQVKEAQSAVVEFLLVNHPLDCPVCDKGGECPLQDITMGWGPGSSRVIDEKRHFEKPIELSPLVAIDRERCILCYRCVRFSQEVAEDEQLQLLERGDRTFVGTFDDRPYIAPFHGNITDLCPVGALTSYTYRFRARPWDIEQAGSVCTLCPSQCNVSFTVRDERVLRVLARQHDEVDDGWLCDKGRFAYQATHVDERITRPLVRDGGELRPVSWDRALDEAAGALRRAGAATGVIAGGDTTNEEALLIGQLVRDGLGSPHLDSSPYGGLPLELRRALAAPALQATVPDLEFAHTVLVLDTEPVDDAPIFDLRIRKGVRRRGVRLAVATSRPSTLDANAAAVARFAPGSGLAFLQGLTATIGGEDASGFADAAGTTVETLDAVAHLLTGIGNDVVVLWGERLASSADAVRALLNLAGALKLADHEGAGLLEVPSAANGRGLREAGILPGSGPGYAEAPAGHDAAGIARAAAAGELTALYLLNADPVGAWPDPRGWERALDRATSVIAHASFLTPTLREHATVIFPAEAPAEREGTVTHPDGRVQRLRPAIGRPGEVRAGWSVISEIAKRAGHDPSIVTGAAASTRLFETIPFYRGLTLEGLAGHGVRWQTADAARALPEGNAGPFDLAAPPPPVSPNGHLRVGTFRPIWAGPEVEASPALKFLVPRPHAELSPHDAERLGLGDGEAVDVGDVRATVAVRSAVPAGTVFVAAGLRDGDLVEVRRP
jgi:NADH-quinone oxidoreductase subunit G